TRSITVGNGGTLQFSIGNVFGGGASTVLTPLIIQAGGVVTNTAVDTESIGPLTLSGGTLTGTGGVATWNMYGFGNAPAQTVTVNGALNSLIGGSGPNDGLDLAASTTFSVAGPGS